jgi:hypothetical protein
MISLFGTTIAATSPWLLLGIPCAIGFLVYIFRVRGTAHQAVVSSLLFLRELPRRPIGRKTFVPPLQFWLELAILILLLLAVSGLYLARSGKHVAIVIDSSLSMGALYGAGGTRLDQAKRIATLDIERAPSSTTYTVFASSKELTPISQPHNSSSDAVISVQGTRQSHRADALQQHLSSLVTDPQYDAVWVYTDHEFKNYQPSARLIINQLPTDPSTSTNAWIQSVQVVRDGSGDLLKVGLGYGGAAAKDALVDGECYSDADSSPVKIGAKTVRLTPTESTTTTLTPARGDWSYCRFHVKLQDSSLFDGLPLDNEGWVTRTSSESAVSLVSSLSSEQLGLSKVKTLRISSDPQQGDTRSLPTIYHRLAPPNAPSTSTLVVLPPPGALPWGGEVQSQAPSAREVTRWDASHPVLHYINPSLVTFPEVRILECPASATPILFSAAGPIACAGEDHGARYLITGFELFPFDGTKNPTISIFTLNAFKWLFQRSDAAATGELPTRLSLPEAVTEAGYIHPENIKLTVQGGSIAPPVPGIVQLEEDDGDERYVALNSFEEKESNLKKGAPLALPAITPNATAPSSPATSRSLISILTLVALLVIGADLARRLVRHSRWGDA